MTRIQELNSRREQVVLELAGIQTLRKGNLNELRIPTIPPTHSEGSRPVIPKDSGHLFQSKAATHSERIGPPISMVGVGFSERSDAGDSIVVCLCI